jgi:chemotaxis protein methyltransferase CheR
MLELGIIETRDIIKALESIHPFEFRNLALTSFKRQLEKIITKHTLRNAQGLIDRLTSDSEFMNVFMHELAVKETEMFRDPSVWRDLQKNIFKDIKASITSYKVWFAGMPTGEEVYSFAILLKEAGLLDKVQIYISAFSDISEENILNKYIDDKQHELSVANYDRAGTKNYLDKYLIQESGKKIDPELIKNVRFIKQNTIFEGAPSNIKLVFFRNQMIYYNQVLQDKALNSVYEAIAIGGHLVIGVNETLDHSSYGKYFIKKDTKENIFRKKGRV